VGRRGSRSDLDARIDAARVEIEEVAGTFARAAGPILAAALERAVERLVVERAEWFNALDDPTASSLRAAVDQAIARSAERITLRLAEPDLWLSPSVWLDSDPPRPAEQLDSHSNRVWISLLNGADGLDPILLEFGLTPSEVPDWGGGHFGLQPQSLGQLDPRGTLGRLWARFVQAHGRYASLLGRRGEIDRRDREAGRDSARRRWRDSG
jgi:hypothetical protein